MRRETGCSVVEGDALDVLRTLPDAAFQCCVTSPPYYGLRDYRVAGQIGLEPTPDEYVARLVAVFCEVRRVLRDDGTLWLNIGDSYNAYNRNRGASTSFQRATEGACPALPAGSGLTAPSFKQKDLIGIPWMLAFALRADGWVLRQEIIWAKPNPMPESVRDRTTKSHEQLFMFSKAPRYFYDADAIAEPAETGDDRRPYARGQVDSRGSGHDRGGGSQRTTDASTRNARSVWTIATVPFSGSHFATMPPALAERCIKAGSKPGDRVLDPFGGAGTTGLVAARLGRSATLIELNPEYAAMARERIRSDAPLLADVA